MIPPSNEDVFILAGALQCLIRAPTNYCNTVKRLATVLKEIDDDVNACETDQQLVRSALYAISYCQNSCAPIFVLC